MTIETFPLAEVDSLLVEDPGSPVFVDYGEFLRQQNRLSDALMVLMRGLTANPSFARGRLVLARVLYDLRCLPFAVRELEIVAAQNPNCKSVRKLLSAIDPSYLSDRAETHTGRSEGGGETSYPEPDSADREIKLRNDALTPSNPFADDVVGEAELVLDEIDFLEE